MNSVAPQEVEWVAVDWGTSNLRAWAMAGDRPLAAVSAPTGMAALARDAFEPALLKTIAPWLAAGRRLPVVACGMVGARQGWVEVPYRSVPSTPHAAAAMRAAPAADPRIAVTIVHGLSQAAPPDVMRGEETQIAGLLALEPGFAGTACLPGTHSKWVSVTDGRIAAFRTIMTGEIFALLSRQSVLRHSMGEGEGFDAAAFAQAVVEIAADPAALGASLFSIRAAGLLGHVAPEASRARLSGLLIGSELAAARALRQDGSVTLIGEPALCRLYERGLAALGVAARTVDAEACTLAGLAAARRALLEQPA
jgi:2-dehydro-3-deoxygalactonokinase